HTLHVPPLPTRRSSDLPSVGPFSYGSRLRRPLLTPSPGTGPALARPAAPWAFSVHRSGDDLQDPFDVVLAVVVDLDTPTLAVPRSEEHTSELQSREKLV